MNCYVDDLLIRNPAKIDIERGVVIEYVTGDDGQIIYDNGIARTAERRGIVRLQPTEDDGLHKRDA